MVHSAANLNGLGTLDMTSLFEIISGRMAVEEEEEEEEEKKEEK